MFPLGLPRIPSAIGPARALAGIHPRLAVLALLTLALALSFTLVGLASPRGDGPPTSSRQVFQELMAPLDLDGDGALAASEWAHWKGHPGELAQFDQDGDGGIDSEEFEIMFMTLDVFHGRRASHP